MRSPPIRTSTGGIGCPRCSTVMKKRDAPFYLHEEYVGVFESIVCPICNYSALTEKGYERAILEAKRIGLVGIKEEMPEIVKLELTINENKIAGNDKPVENSTLVEDITYLQQPTIANHFTKKVFIKTRPNT